jgi:ribonuclease VapC
MMVIDSSAMIAILRLEAEADAFLRAIASADSCFMSAISTLETAMVLAGATGDAALWAPLDELLAKAAVEIVPFDGEQSRLARDAFIRFGKGRHAAGLNLGDCVAYALAASRKLPLLFKGDDFAKTDLEVAAV